MDGLLSNEGTGAERPLGVTLVISPEPGRTHVSLRAQDLWPWHRGRTSAELENTADDSEGVLTMAPGPTTVCNVSVITTGSGGLHP